MLRVRDGGLRGGTPNVCQEPRSGPSESFRGGPAADSFAGRMPKGRSAMAHMPSPSYAARLVACLSDYPFPRFRRIEASPRARSPMNSGFCAPENHAIARKNGRKRKQRPHPSHAPAPSPRILPVSSQCRQASRPQANCLPGTGRECIRRPTFPPETHAETLAEALTLLAANLSHNH